MHSFKKIAALIAVLAALVGLAACGSETETSSFQLFDTQGIDQRETYSYQGDRVIKVQTKNTILYSVYHLNDKAEAEEKLKDGFDEFKNIKGIKHQVTYQEDRLIEILEIDYTKVDLKKHAKLLNIHAADTDKVKYISFEKTKENLVKRGYQLITDDNYRNLPNP